MRTTLTLCLVALLTACGGGGSDAPQAEAPAVVKPAKVVYFGNSLTYVKEWFGGWGLSVTAPELDYVHISSKALGAPFEAYNWQGDALTTDERVAAYAATVTPDSVVVVQLAENIDGTYAFVPILKRVIAAAKPARRIVCIGSWWPSVERDSIIQAACTEAGGRFVDVSDLINSPLNTDKNLPKFDNPAVDSHPKNWGMARIAERVVAAAQ
jgi:hypothetical protein